MSTLRSWLNNYGIGRCCAAILLFLTFGRSPIWGEPPEKGALFGVRIVDEQTGRGVPLATLRTVHDAVYVTDSNGWAAIAEPDLADRHVFFHIESPGYEIPPDGFGFRGRRIKFARGRNTTVKIRRTSIAQRLYRVTGQGIYRDTELLGLEPPMELPQRNAGVMGQDSVQAVPYRGQLFWLWGDTNLANYPLGNFQVTAATSPLPKDFAPDSGVPLSYFMEPKNPERVRKMMPLAEPGAVWLFGLVNIKGPDGEPTLVAHYSRQRKLGEVLEHGLARFDDRAGIFRRIKRPPIEETGRFPRGNAVSVAEDDKQYIYFCQPLAHTRVAAKWESIIDPAAYEALAWDAKTQRYRWQKEAAPTTQRNEQRLIEAGKLPREQARFALIDAETDSPVTLHRASICRNDFRKRWIMIGNQEGTRDTPSYLGEVWYAEAESIAGPWSQAVKIATHPKYSFYNPRQHPLMATENGRFVFFEGTYTRMFSASPVATPRYDYNQIMYRLDLSDERLRPAQD